MMNSFISNKFKFWSFVSMVLLVFVHGYNLEMRYLQPWTTPFEPLTPTTFIEYLLANGLFRFRIPMLFIISGYLYSLHDQTPNRQRIGKRFRTLFIPYLIWSAFGLALTFVLELFPYTQHLVVDSHVVQIDYTRMQVHDYTWYEVLNRWIFFPVSYQLWFIRVLFIYNLAYPGIRWCVESPKARWVFFSIATFLWISTINFGLVEGEGLLFFGLGIWIQKSNFSIHTAGRWLQPNYWGIFFIVLAIVKTVLAFKGYGWMGNAVYPVLVFMHKLTVVSGLIACWFGLDKLVSFFIVRSWFIRISSFAFIIYAMHAPMVAFFINGFFQWLHFLPAYRMATFILLPLAIIAICILTGVGLRKLSPSVYGILTGGRGL